MAKRTVHISDLEKDIVALIYDKKINEASRKISDSLYLKMQSDKDRAYKYAKENIKEHLKMNLRYMNDGFIDFMLSNMRQIAHRAKGKFKETYLGTKPL